MTRRLFAFLPQAVITPGNTLFRPPSQEELTSIAPLKNGQCPVCLTQAPPYIAPKYPTSQGDKPYPIQYLVDCKGKFRGGRCRNAFWQDAENK